MGIVRKPLPCNGCQNCFSNNYSYFHCNSGDDARCGDPFSFQDMAGEYLYHCPDNENGKEYFCQKMIYKDIVHRSCQHIRQDQSGDTGLCHDTTVDGEYAFICECEDEGCNSGSQVKISLISILSAAVVAYLRL